MAAFKGLVFFSDNFTSLNCSMLACMLACMLEQLQARRTLTHSTAHTIQTGHNKLMAYINIEGSGKNVTLDKREKLSLAFEHLPGMQITLKVFMHQP
ncbi:hypothetical protein P5673_001204 [Acropora cervicornis]|uniref:Uncharacterized protein n=1 Tax=Acropora cervicornis TaxID=6130 RepID=A0AAD9R5Q5_ACRCE|nr:hypothetical protein P5673_001204 [Acropora cervicornis]